MQISSKALSSNFGKRPLAKLGKTDQLNVKIGKNKQHKNGSKIYPQNQVILDCFIPSTSVFKSTVIPLLQGWASIRIITLHGDGGGPLLEATSARIRWRQTTRNSLLITNSRCFCILHRPNFFQYSWVGLY